jgi:hypothetical protein
MINTRNIGLDLAVIGSAICVIGVLLFNIFRMYREATIILCISSIIFMVYFYGQWKDYWDGGLSSEVIFMMYCVLTAIGLYGVMTG